MLIYIYISIYIYEKYNSYVMFFQQDCEALLIGQLRKLLETAAASQLSQLGTPLTTSKTILFELKPHL